MSINSRIVKLAHDLRMNISELSRQTGIKQSTLNNITSGDTIPRSDTIIMLINHFKDLNARWLLTGEGNMWNNSTDKTSEVVISDVNVEEIRVAKSNDDNILNDLIAAHMAAYSEIVRLRTEVKILREQQNEK